MRIGIAGIPGAGKTDLAYDLQVLLCKEGMGKHGVIDNYVEQVEERTSIALGFWASYLGNIHIAMERARLESQAEDVITCGTLIETSAYQAYHGARMLALEDEAERTDELRRVEAAMKMLACLYVDTFLYDYVFYLPGGVDPGPGSTVSATDLRELDKSVQTAFSAFNLVKVITLDEMGVNRPSQAMEKIREGQAERV